MFAILNSLNAHNFPIIQPILMILVSKFMVHKAFSDKTYLSIPIPIFIQHKTLHIMFIALVHINCERQC